MKIPKSKTFIAYIKQHNRKTSIQKVNELKFPFGQWNE